MSDVSVSTPTRTFKNKYLSVSRLNRYEQCALSFFLHYVQRRCGSCGKDVEQRIKDEKITYWCSSCSNYPNVVLENQGDAKIIALLFGTVLHETLEYLFKWVVSEEFSGQLPVDVAVGYYKTAWTKSGLTGLQLYNEGLKLIRQYVHNNASVDHLDILGIEQDFEIQCGEFNVVGSIDRADKVNDTTVKVIDYKSNRMLFSSDELESNLQMSVYGLAVIEKLWPWATTVEFEFHMLRHGRPLKVTRTREQLEDARDYVIIQGKKTETDTEWAPNLNTNCIYCDQQSRCELFQKEISKDKPDLVVLGDEEKLGDLIEDRERCQSLEKAFKKRKDTIDTILKKHLENAEQLEVDGYIVRYDSWIPPWQTGKYDTRKAVDLLHQILKIPREDILMSIASVDRQKLESFFAVASETVSRSRASLAKAELEVLEQREPSQRLKVQAPKGVRRRSKSIVELGKATTKPNELPTLAREVVHTTPSGVTVPTEWKEGWEKLTRECDLPQWNGVECETCHINVLDKQHSEPNSWTVPGTLDRPTETMVGDRLVVCPLCGAGLDEAGRCFRKGCSLVLGDVVGPFNVSRTCGDLERAKGIKTSLLVVSSLEPAERGALAQWAAGMTQDVPVKLVKRLLVSGGTIEKASLELREAFGIDIVEGFDFKLAVVSKQKMKTESPTKKTKKDIKTEEIDID